MGVVGVFAWELRLQSWALCCHLRFGGFRQVEGGGGASSWGDSAPPLRPPFPPPAAAAPPFVHCGKGGGGEPSPASGCCCSARREADASGTRRTVRVGPAEPRSPPLCQRRRRDRGSLDRVAPGARGGGGHIKLKRHLRPCPPDLTAAPAFSAGPPLGQRRCAWAGNALIAIPRQAMAQGPGAGARAGGGGGGCPAAANPHLPSSDRGPRFPGSGNSRRLSAVWVRDTGEGFLLKDQREESLCHRLRDTDGGKTGKNGGKTGKNGGKRGKTGGNGGKWGKMGKHGGKMGEDGNCDECSCLLHCHYFLYTYPCLCCSHLHTDMSNFHPHEGILYVRIQHLVSQKWALSSDISKALTRLGASSVRLLACTAASMGDVDIDDFLFAMCVTLWGWDA